MKRCCECGRPLEDDMHMVVRDFGVFCSTICLARFRGDWDCNYEEEEYERTEDDEY